MKESWEDREYVNKKIGIFRIIEMIKFKARKELDDADFNEERRGLRNLLPSFLRGDE